MMLRKAHVATMVVGVALVAGVVGTINNNRNTVAADQTVGTARLLTESKTVKAGQEFTVGIKLDTGDDSTTGVDALLTYDPSILDVVDADPAQAGTQIVDNKLLEFSQSNQVDTKLGQVAFSAGQSPTSDALNSNDGLLATVRFKAKVAGRSTLRFAFTSGATDDSNVIEPNEGRDLLAGVQDGIVTVTE